MGLEEKIKNAKETDWLSEGLSKRKIRRIIFFAKLHARFFRLIKKREIND